MTHAKEEANDSILRKKADAHFLLGTMVHIPFKSGHWKRGVIKEVKADMFLLDERVEGRVPVFFEEIKDIRPYTPKPQETSND